MLNRPIVTVNFNHVLHFDFFENIGGTLHCRTMDEFERALQEIVLNPMTRADLAERCAQAVDRLARFDGRATERIADLLDAPDAPSTRTSTAETAHSGRSLVDSGLA
jgi:hypothetical protein